MRWALPSIEERFLCCKTSAPIRANWYEARLDGRFDS